MKYTLETTIPSTEGLDVQTNVRVEGIPETYNLTTNITDVVFPDGKLYVKFASDNYHVYNLFEVNNTENFDTNVSFATASSVTDVLNSKNMHHLVLYKNSDTNKYYATPIMYGLIDNNTQLVLLDIEMFKDPNLENGYAQITDSNFFTIVKSSDTPENYNVYTFSFKYKPFIYVNSTSGVTFSLVNESAEKYQLVAVNDTVNDNLYILKKKNILNNIGVYDNDYIDFEISGNASSAQTCIFSIY